MKYSFKISKEKSSPVANLIDFHNLIKITNREFGADNVDISNCRTVGSQRMYHLTIQSNKESKVLTAMILGGYLGYQTEQITD